MKNNIKLNEIKGLLNSSSSHISAATLENLRAARTRALDHQRTTRNAPVFAWLGQQHGGNHAPLMARPYSWIVALLFIACLISGVSIWNSYTAEHEITEVDVAILTDDLPIHALLD